MRFRHFSAGVAKMHWPEKVFAEMERQLWKEDKTTPGTGRFLYVPFVVLVSQEGARVVGGDDSLQFAGGDMTLIGKDDDIVEVVGMLVKRRITTLNLKAKPGDTCFQLRSEWNETENPLR